MITLRRGSNAPEVMLLQRLLNTHYMSTPSADVLNEDGIFGGRTDALLRRFQGEYTGPAGRLPTTGSTDPATWRALDLRADVAHSVPQVGQTGQMSCWVVCAGLASGSMQSRIPETARFNPANRPAPGGGPGGGLPDDRPNLTRYAADNNMRLLAQLPRGVSDLITHIRRGPAILIGVWQSGGLHAVVISAAYQTGQAYTSMIRVNNPAPMGRGSTELTEYPGMMLQSQGFTPRDLIVK